MRLPLGTVVDGKRKGSGSGNLKGMDPGPGVGTACISTLFSCKFPKTGWQNYCCHSAEARSYILPRKQSPKPYD